MSQAITPSQLLTILNYQTQDNVNTANEILQDAVDGNSPNQLTPTSLAALGDIMLNECGGYLSTDAYAISAPVTGGSAGTSGWTIGILQQDFANGAAAAITLASALQLSGNQQLSMAAAQISAALAANNVTPVSDTNPQDYTIGSTGYSLSQVNAALQTPAAEASLRDSAYLGVNTIANNISTFVGNLINASVAAALTPGNVAFDPTAYVALADYANQFGLDPNKSPFINLFNTGTTVFSHLKLDPNGTDTTVTIPGGSFTAAASLSNYIQLGEYATQYAYPDGSPNSSADTTLQGRIAVQDLVGNGFAKANTLTVSAASNFLLAENDGDSQTITIEPAGSAPAEYINTSVQLNALGLEATACAENLYWSSQIGETGVVESGGFQGTNIYTVAPSAMDQNDYAVGLTQSDITKTTGAGFSLQLTLAYAIQDNDTQQLFQLTSDQAQQLHDAIGTSGANSVIQGFLPQLDFYYNNSGRGSLVSQNPYQAASLLPWVSSVMHREITLRGSLMPVRSILSPWLRSY